MNTTAESTSPTAKGVITLPQAPATFFKMQNHDYFFVKDNELYERLKSGKARHRITLTYRTAAERWQDTERLTDYQVKLIEGKYLR